MNESGFKLRSKIDSVKTLRARTDGLNSYSAGDMVVVGDTIGVIVEDVGPNSDFVLVYEAEKIVVPKAEGRGCFFSSGDKVYFDILNGEVTNYPKGNVCCGRALENVDLDDGEVLIDLMVLE